MKKILIVEDDKIICNELKMLLENAEYEVYDIKNWKNSKNEILNLVCDLILMDINLPNINGEILLKEIRKYKDTPVIMITSKNSEADEVLSYSFGADDYITKPYNPTILLLKISAIFKRCEAKKEVIDYLDLKINVNKGIMCKGTEEIVLTKNEMIIFYYLLNNKARIVTRDELMTELWSNDEYINDNALTVNISRLRNKLSSLGYSDAIQTRKKQGYILL